MVWFSGYAFFPVDGLGRFVDQLKRAGSFRDRRGGAAPTVVCWLCSCKPHSFSEALDLICFIIQGAVASTDPLVFWSIFLWPVAVESVFVLLCVFSAHAFPGLPTDDFSVIVERGLIHVLSWAALLGSNLPKI
jgi:hypothetical protein